jgi:hypothetical protein
VSFLLWIEFPNRAVDLGNPIEVLIAFKELAQLDSGRDYEELWEVSINAEQDVSEEWITKVREWTSRFLSTYRDRLTEVTQYILRDLADPENE